MATPIIGNNKSLKDVSVFTKDEYDACISGTEELIKQLTAQVPWEVAQGVPAQFPAGQLLRTISTMKAYRAFLEKLQGSEEDEAVLSELKQLLDPVVSRLVALR